tara:strand:+ start:334 stop:564 length:231 start_codon:yes stop_codon:yes gene_type:complete
MKDLLAPRRLYIRISGFILKTSDFIKLLILKRSSAVSENIKNINNLNTTSLVYLIFSTKILFELYNSMLLFLSKKL